MALKVWDEDPHLPQPLALGVHPSPFSLSLTYNHLQTLSLVTEHFFFRSEGLKLM